MLYPSALGSRAATTSVVVISNTGASFSASRTSIPSLYYYTTQALSHILRNPPRGKLEVLYYLAASAVIFIGAGLSADLLWGIADVTMGLMALINMPVILYLGKYAYVPLLLDASHFL